MEKQKRKSINRKKRKFSEDETIDTSKRNFLKYAIASAVALTLSDSSQNISEKTKEDSQNIVEEGRNLDKNFLPNIRFESMSTFPKPSIAEKLDEAKIKAIAQQLNTIIESDLENFKYDVARDYSPRRTIRILGAIYNKIHTLFAAQIPDFNWQERDIHKILIVINEFLVHVGKYFYVQYRLTKNPMMNLFSVSDQNRVVVNGKDSGKQLSLEKGMIQYPGRQPEGKIDDVDKRLMLIWPDEARAYYESNAHKLPQHDQAVPKEEFIRKMIETTKYHEAAHMYVFEKFPKIARLFFESHRHHPKLMEASNRNEVCGKAAGLSKTSSLQEGMSLLISRIPVYQMAKELFFEELNTIIDEDIRAGRLRVPAGLEHEKLRIAYSYLKRQQSPEVLHRIGKNLFKKGLALLAEFEGTL